MPSDSNQTPAPYTFCGCQCGCPPDQPAKPRSFSCTAQKEPIRSIKVLDCEAQTSRQFYDIVLQAIQHLGLSPEVAYVSEPRKTSPYYVDFPALVVDERVRAQGNCLTVEEVEALLQ